MRFFRTLACILPAPQQYFQLSCQAPGGAVLSDLQIVFQRTSSHWFGGARKGLTESLQAVYRTSARCPCSTLYLSLLMHLTSLQAPPVRKGEQSASQPQPIPTAATPVSRRKETSARKGEPAHSSSPSACVQTGDAGGPQMKQTDLSESPPSWPAKRRRTPGAGTGTSATNQPDARHSPRASTADGRRMRSLNELQVGQMHTLI